MTDAQGRIRAQGHNLAVGELQYHFSIGAGAEDRVGFEHIPGLGSQRFSGHSLHGDNAGNFVHVSALTGRVCAGNFAHVFRLRPGRG